MPNSSLPDTIQFNYIKSNHFRVLHVDGLIGGPTPNGLIFMSLYSERGAIPQITFHEVTEGGRIGTEHLDERVTKKGIVREVEVGLILSVETAASLVTWLQEKIDITKKLQNPPEAEKSADESSTH